MKLKKKAKRIIFIFVLILIVIGALFINNYLGKNKEGAEVKIVDEIEKYGYKLKDNKTKRYEEYFNELKDILNKKPVDEEAYVKKISEMFIYDFYSLNDKKAKTDVGGVDFVYPEILENFLENAENTYYKYVESNIYNNRKQSLPTVSKINIESVEKEEYAYQDKNDQEAYHVKVTWSYTDDNFSDYQKEAELIFIHIENILYLVELQ